MRPVSKKKVNSFPRLLLITRWFNDRKGFGVVWGMEDGRGKKIGKWAMGRRVFEGPKKKVAVLAGLIR